MTPACGLVQDRRRADLQFISLGRLDSGADDDVEPEIYRVLQEDAGETPRDDDKIVSLERRGSLLAG